MKEVHKLTGMAAALNRFISRSLDKCRLVAHKKGWVWMRSRMWASFSWIEAVPGVTSIIDNSKTKGTTTAVFGSVRARRQRIVVKSPGSRAGANLLRKNCHTIFRCTPLWYIRSSRLKVLLEKQISWEGSQRGPCSHVSMICTISLERQ